MSNIARAEVYKNMNETISLMTHLNTDSGSRTEVIELDGFWACDWSALSDLVLSLVELESLLSS